MSLKIFLIIIIIGMICFAVGYTLGFRSAVYMGVKGFFKLMEYKKINIDIDEQALRNGILQYKENINGCLFLQNKTNEIP